ncbi:MAG: hypothetical protein CMD14_01475 [Flavobacteriales bacterium]|nr:hypothetical protein [Flavobacteriales bacterium]|tara:strand:- start:10910 stop:11188 length:279 start_codon:yes stop_codon:yes gene_type:complete
MLVDGFLVTFILLILYVFLLFLVKKLSFGAKIKSRNCNNCCPDCNHVLSRIQRKRFDYFLNYITFRVFDARRYLCSNCGWEGLRWEKKFKPS